MGRYTIFSRCATTTGRSCSGIEGAAGAGHDAGLDGADRPAAIAEGFQSAEDPYEFATPRGIPDFDWLPLPCLHLYRAYAIADKFARTFREFRPFRSPTASPR